MKIILTTLCVAALVAGCATPPPRSDAAKSVPVPTNWISSALSDEVQNEWWRQFGDESLNAAVEEALGNNHDLKQAVARVDAAVAQARIAGADWYPQAGFNFDAQRQQNVYVGLPIPGAGGPLKSRSTSYGADFNISWELDVWGRIRAGQRAALADVQAAAADLRGARESLAAQTAKAWMASVEARRQLELARATAENYSTVSTQVRDRYERGIRSPLDLRLALSSASAARALVASRQSQVQSTARQLEFLLGRYPAARLDETNDLPSLARSVPAGLPSELLERRPDLVAAERHLAASAQRVREAKAALFPRISLTTTGGRTSSELDDLLNGDFNIWSIAGHFAQPLFQGGKLRANVKLSEARQREAAETYLSTVLRAFQEVENALANEQHLARREAELAQAAEQSVAAQRLAEERYRSGLEELVTLLEAQRRALDSESQWITVRRLRFENRVDLYLALGGGFAPAPQEQAAR